jgi:hypothetical protein
MHHVQYYLRELLKLFTQYLAVGFCSIPATIVYFAILGTANSPGLAIAGSIVSGFACAYFVWRWLDHVFAAKPQPKVIRFEPILITNEELPLQSFKFAETLTFVVVVVAAGHVIAGADAGPRPVCFPPLYNTISDNVLVGLTNADTVS